MSLLNRAKLDIKLGEYAVGSATVLVDPLLVTAAQDYRRQTAARMIPLEPADVLKRFPAGDYHVSLKIDGEFSLLVYADGEVLTVNPGGTVRTGLPWMKEAAGLLKKAGVKQATIPGELHFLREAGQRARVHDVSRVARQPATTAELDKLAFAAFDVVECDGKKPAGPVAETFQQLGELFHGGKRCTVVDHIWAKDAAGIDGQFRTWLERNAEGAVVRSDALGSFKLKPRHTLDAVVIGFTEGTEDRRGLIHDLLLAVMRPDGCLHVLGHVGGGFTTDDRRAFLSDLKDDLVTSDYVEVNDQVAYQMVRPECILEISVLDLIAETTRGMPINKMVLDWNSAKNHYEIVRRLPLVGLISPQYVRRREDKVLNVVDIRIQQVTDLVEVALTDRDARRLNRTPSTLIRRVVGTKVLKGATMVRKLVMWQTNKERDGEFPAFVIHSTDFSPNRKTPLERDLRVSSSREQIEELWNELAAESFTKGWDLVRDAGDPNAAAGPTTAVVPAKAAKKPAKTAPAPAAAPDPDPASPPAPKKRASPKKKPD